MKNFLTLYRRLFRPPRPTFVAHLRQKILRRAHKNEFAFGDFLSQKYATHPSGAFRIQLKNKILLRAHPRKRLFSFIRFFQKTKRTLVAAGSVTVSAFLVSLLGLFIFRTAPIEAATNTRVSAVVGDVFVEYGRQKIPLRTHDILREGAVITTGENSMVVVRFFEDSLVRLHASSALKIKQLSPYNKEEESGRVSLELFWGQVWARTFFVADGTSPFTLRVGSVIASFDAFSAASFFHSSAETRISVWDRILRLSNASVAIVAQEKEWKKNWSQETYSKSKRDSWITKNESMDRAVLQNFLEEKRQERITQITLFPEAETTPRRALEQSFLDALLALEQGAPKPLDSFERHMEEALIDSPDDLRRFLLSAEKTLFFVHDSSPFFPAQNMVSKWRVLSASIPTVVREQQKTNRLWRANNAAKSGDIPLAHNLLLPPIIPQKIQSESEDTIVKTEILEEKEEQMLAIASLEEKDVSPKVLETLQDNIVEEVTEIVRPNFPNRKKSARSSEELIAVVTQFSTQSGQKNTLNARLKNMPNTADSLAVLVETRKNLPEYLRGTVNKKIIDIINAEQER